MDPRLLDYYDRELRYFRQMAGEFASQFPKIAARLNMSGIEVADPYVERLLEGVSFLTARVHLKMDAEFPRFSQRLLEIAYPGYLAPTPAATVVRLEPKLFEGGLNEGFTIARGSTLRSQVMRNDDAVCDFRTAHDVTLWPLLIDRVEFTGPPPDLHLGSMRLPGTVRSALRIFIKTPGELAIQNLGVDSLTFFLSGPEEIAARLHELLFTRCMGVASHDATVSSTKVNLRPANSLRRQGFAESQAMFPCPNVAFGGYRLLHEYFAFPSRFLFFSVDGLAPAFRGAAGESIGITILLDQAVPDLERVVDSTHLALFCTPAVNLFTKRADRIQVTGQRYEYHLVADRAAPLNYEIHSVQRVVGHSSGNLDEREFRPFYRTLGDDRGDYGAYYSLRREPRVLSDTARRNGTRTGYVGSEVYISLVDQHDAPFSGDLRQLSIEALCTNRDLALLLPLGGASDFFMTASAPVEAVKVMRGPSRPSPALAERDITWRLISHLSLNYLTLTDVSEAEGAAALRELLDIYAVLAENAMRSHVKGVTRVAVNPVTRRLPRTGPLAFGRGVQVALTVDESSFGGISPFLLGCVLEEFFARHVSINTFTETVLDSLQRGRIATWPSRIGRRPVA
jgi:type VI secretion system protein ImpG